MREGGSAVLGVLKRKLQMAIKKQEFYEGAALHQVIRASGAVQIQYHPPFFVLDSAVAVYLKYSTKNRGPWGFTFTPDEQQRISLGGPTSVTILGLVCGSDGVAALSQAQFLSISRIRSTALNLSCARRYGEHYEVSGPDGVLKGKVAPSRWTRLIKEALREALRPSDRAAEAANF